MRLRESPLHSNAVSECVCAGRFVHLAVSTQKLLQIGVLIFTGVLYTIYDFSDFFSFIRQP